MIVYFSGNSILKEGFAMTMRGGSLLSYHYNNLENSMRPLWDEKLKTYLVSFPSQKPQADALSDASALNHLMSYEFRREEDPYSVIWEDSLRIHLADTSNERGQFNLLSKEKPDTLLSFHYRNTEKDHSISWRGGKKANVMIDSGAFSAFTCGKIIKREEYLEWATGFQSRWKDKLDSLNFMNLDVIGDPEKSWENLHWFESKGFNPLPIITKGESPKKIKYAIQNYEYLAVGALVGEETNTLIQRLDQVFFEWLKERNRTGRMVKIHLLGVTIPSILYRYPAYSTDSSSWTAPLRFGRGKAASIEKLPRYKEGESAMDSNLYALRKEIKKYIDLEKNVTHLWEQRGVKW